MTAPPTIPTTRGRAKRRFIALCLGLAWTAPWLATGCATDTHVKPYEPKRRELPEDEVDEALEARDGSLMALDQPGLVADDRAWRIGDLVIIRIDEAEKASRTADTQLERSNRMSLGIPKALGLMSALQGAGVDPSALISAQSDKDFHGRGEIERRGRLNATLPVRVRRILPNRDFFVEGSKVILVSNEEHHLYVSGIIRRVDIGPDNAVPSSLVADAEIEYSGRGDATDQQRPGWLSRMLESVWPF